MNISILTGYKDDTADTDGCSVPLSWGNEFKKLGHNVRYYDTINRSVSNISQLDPRAWTEDGLKQLIIDAKSGYFIPHIVFHCDFGLFQSPLLSKDSFPSAKWVCEAGDDPQCMQYNIRKFTHGKFDLIHSPDIRCVKKYLSHGYNAVWSPHFADFDLKRGVIQKPIYDAVTTRHKDEEFFKELGNKLTKQNITFEARTDFLEGKEHVRHLKKGKIVVQNSKYKEITRRIFEGMICNRLVITDRIDPSTGIDEIFKENRDIIYFDNIDECVDKIRFYSEFRNTYKREIISTNGYMKVLGNHVVSKRAEKLLKLL